MFLLLTAELLTLLQAHPSNEALYDLQGLKQIRKRQK